MEESKNSTNENHDPKKYTRVVHGDGKSVRVVNSQKYKHKSAKIVKDLEGRSPSGNSIRQNRNNAYIDQMGEAKSSKANMQNCTTGSKVPGSNRLDQSDGKSKKASQSVTMLENATPARGQAIEVPGSQNVENGVLETDTPVVSINSTSEDSPEIHKPKECSDPVVDSEIVKKQEEILIEPDELDKVRNLVPTELENGAVIESSSTEEQKLGLKQAEERLERDYIFRLEKPSPDYTNFHYLCKLCQVHIENIQGAHKHIKEKRHKKNIAEKQEENELRSLPPPSPSQVAALRSALMQAAKEHGISDEEFTVRQEIVNEMEKIIRLHLPDCSLRLYGSCLTRFAFKTSDINIDVKFPTKMTQPDVLIKVLEILKNCDLYSDVESDFHAKVPVVFCQDNKSGLMCKVSAGNDVACLTTDLLAALGKLEPSLIPLVLAFRYWARLCHIDCQSEGGIPSYSFALMVMFFLQQRKPPILPAYLGKWMEGFESKRLDDHQLKDIEAGKFLRWEYKLTNNNESRNSGANSDGKSKVEQQKGGLKKASHSEVDSNAPKTKSGKSPLVFDKPHDVSLGQLWLELLKFYTLEFALEEYVISVRVQELLTRENKNWPKRRIAIEDPFALKRNVARSLNSQMVFEYILERFRTAYKYFACPQRKDCSKNYSSNKKKEKSDKKSENCGELVTSCCLPDGGSVDKKNPESRHRTRYSDIVKCNEKQSIPAQHLINGPECLLRNNLNTVDSSCDSGRLKTVSLTLKDSCIAVQTSVNSVNDDSLDCRVEPSNSNCCEQNSLLTKAVHEHTCTNNSGDCSTTCTAATSPVCKATLEAHDLKDEGNVSDEEMHYVFDAFILTSGKPPTIVCRICKRDGHSKNDCPEDFKKIDLKPLPPMTNRFREILDKVCKRCFDELSPHTCEQHGREQILAYLERFIRKEFNDKARLCLFGSSKNGFGFRDSDLDICMTLEGHENAEKLNCKEIIEGLAKILKKHPGLRNILPITTAKVPIVKFEHRESLLEGDISLYNTLAQHNTRMLALYAAIDPRVKYLGYTIKFFAKRCDVGDASRGSLSSYAYILMVLYFLQQRDPPVIPVLQELYDGNKVPQKMVDGWNAYFFENIDELKRVPSHGKNTETLGELWLGLLRFYTEEFDFKEYVISIRQKKLLTTFEKQWTSKCIAIEDPFDLNHNLGAGVSRKMTNFIMKAFINGRKLFGTPFYPLPGREVDYFFDSKVLTDGELAPNDRCCRVCGKIGHYMKDCPKRRRIKKKENEKDDEKDIKEEEREPREKRCFTCGDVGHVRRDCPEHKQVRQRNNSSILVTQLLQSLMNPQPVILPGQQQSRSRQSSECSDSHQPSYSPQPQPQPFMQNSSPTASVNASQSQQTISQPKHVQQQPTVQQSNQVQMPVFNFPHSPPGQYSALHNLGLVPMHHPHQIQLSNTSWPAHGPGIHSSPSTPPHSSGVTFSLRSGSSISSTHQSNVSLNDPSIIFAQPAATAIRIPSTSREGHWQTPMTPNARVSNGTVGNSDPTFQGQFCKMNPTSVPWEHGPHGHYPLFPASWPYNLTQNYMQQGSAGYRSNKPLYSQAGQLMQNNQRFTLLSPGPPHLNMNFVHQKK
ncbi:terminal uridylyltransferase 4 isoform X2 [Pleurodeles waltl]|uniref:terminal uridylyltransferase 4 isoform X2 n=1 Tax=Pleurodeles waltl TaxID=8319 RepID=UPI0037094E90